MLRKLGILLLVLLLVAVIGDTAVWFWVVRKMRTGWNDWMAGQRAGGWTVVAGTPEPGGWPFAARLSIPDVSLQGGRAAIPDGMAWGAQRLTLQIAARDPRLLRIGASGAQHLRISDGPEIAYTAQQLHVLMHLPANPSDLPLDLRGEALRAGLAGDENSALGIGLLTAHLTLHPDAGHGEPAATLTADATDLALPQTLPWALGSHMASFQLDAALTGPLPAAIGPTAAATAWRDSGGTLVVHHAATQWGPLGLSANGTLHLDAQLQLAGSCDATITGYGATLDALARHGVMARSAALAATAVLSLLAETPAGGGEPVVEVPLSLQDHVLFMQRVPLLRVPALDWPPR